MKRTVNTRKELTPQSEELYSMGLKFIGSLAEDKSKGEQRERMKIRSQDATEPGKLKVQ